MPCRLTRSHLVKKSGSVIRSVQLKRVLFVCKQALSFKSLLTGEGS